MEGFFYKVEKKKKKKSTQEKKQGCSSCGLYKNRYYEENRKPEPQITYQGLGRKKILLIGSAPCAHEDKYNKLFDGEPNQILLKYLKKYGIILKRDCWYTNAVLCRTSKGSSSTSKQIHTCKPNILKIINELKPEKIFCFGKEALQSLIGEKISITSISKYVGWQIPDQEYKCWIYPNYNPAYLYIKDKNKDKALYNYFEDIIAKSINHNEPFFTNEKNIKIINDPEKIVDTIYNILTTKKEIVFDYETTGLKPYKEGHEIICCSIATDECSVAFPLLKDDPAFIILFKKLMGKYTKKIAQNIKFEHLWTKHILNINIENWHWDTMIASHILDNRTGITKLKFQTYINFGEVGYDKEIKPYLESDDYYGFNKIKQFPLEKTLEYCALDSYWEYKLYKKQQKELKNIGAYKLLHDGNIELQTIEDNGIKVGIDYFKTEQIKLNNKIKDIKIKIKDSDELKIWNKNENSNFNINSSPQLKKLLFTYLNYVPTKETATGQPSTDHEALEKINTSFVKNILNLRKYQKISNTYLSNFIDKSYKEYLHPSFNLHIPRTYRSSSDNPNFQNIPVRDAEAGDLLRKGIIPRTGNILLEVDYDRIEVGVSACYHEDPIMLEYINNKDSDMHRDMAAEIFIIDKQEVTKSLRHLSKNCFVFPQFYGDYYINCANNIWDKGGTEVKRILRKNGIKNIFQFQEHMQSIEDYFWNERFKIYNKWKDDYYNEYLKNGYIEFKTGFICKGVMNKKDVCNYPIQGSAFHILLWSLIHLNRYLKDNNFKSLIIGQIHDSIIFDVVPKELPELKKVIEKIMCNDVKEYWDWIIIPLSVEMEATKINGNWYEKEEI